MSKKKKTSKDFVKLEEDYIAFLRKRLDSDNFKTSVSKEEYDKTKRKYDKAKLKLKFIKNEL